MQTQIPGAARLLLVEPDGDLRASLHFLLQDQGYTVVAVSSLADALAQIHGRLFGLILTDLFDNPGTEPPRGVDLLRQAGSPTPVGILTAWRRLPEAEHLPGVCFTLSKPFDIDDLLSRVAACLLVPLTEEQRAQSNVIRAYFATLGARDWDRFVGLCTEDVSYTLPGTFALARTLSGKAALRAYTEETFRQFLSARFEHIAIHSLPHGLVARYEGHWTAADGRQHTQSGAVVFQFAGQHIARIGVQLNEEHLRALLS
jgi:ketosteroid isomerase-like protein/CheY-like chemotaxis protein